MDLAKWWADWQSVEHAVKFDFRASVPGRILVRDFESFNDVRLLNECLEATGEKLLLEIGCATGDFYRYMRIRHPTVVYRGVDVSRPAIQRAKNKYPDGAFHIVDPDWDQEAIVTLCDNHRPQILFSKDVLHHQVKPFDFLSRILALPSEILVFRTRTRDCGPTEWDPEKSCQHHYGGWMPYIVMNLDEVLQHIRRMAPAAEIVVQRNHMVLGGQYARYLPKDCYVEQTGTAETAIRVSLITSHPGRISVTDRLDAKPRYSTLETIILGARKAILLARQK